MSDDPNPGLTGLDRDIFEAGVQAGRHHGDPGPDRAWVYLRIGSWSLYGWRLSVFLLVMAVAYGVGQGIAGSL